MSTDDSGGGSQDTVNQLPRCDRPLANSGVDGGPELGSADVLLGEHEATHPCHPGDPARAHLSENAVSAGDRSTIGINQSTISGAGDITRRRDQEGCSDQSSSTGSDGCEWAAGYRCAETTSSVDGRGTGLSNGSSDPTGYADPKRSNTGSKRYQPRGNVNKHISCPGSNRDEWVCYSCQQTESRARDSRQRRPHRGKHAHCHSPHKGHISVHANESRSILDGGHRRDASTDQISVAVGHFLVGIKVPFSLDQTVRAPNLNRSEGYRELVLGND